MSNTGNGSDYLKKDTSQPGLIPQTGFKSLRWKHQASAGDTVINIQSLTTPPSTISKDFLQPNAATRAAVDHFKYMNNFRLESTLRTLSMNEDFRITGPQTIVLEIAAQEGEIFTGTMMAFPVSGNIIVDANTDPITVTLPAGQTDISIGTYAVNKNPSAQHGQYTVHEDGQLIYRNFGNQPDGEGSYYELDGIIRFNNTSTEDRNISLIPTAAIVHAPDDSLLQKLQVVSGKVDSMIPTLAAEAGVPESTFGGVSDPDVKAHGARVVQNEADIKTLNSREWNQADFYEEIAIPAADMGSYGTQNFKLVRIGSLITLTATSFSTLASTSSNTDTFIPAHLSPPVNTYFYTADGSRVENFSIVALPGGALSIVTDNNAGAISSNILPAFSISWAI